MRPRVMEQRRPRRRNFPLGIVLSLVFLILGVAVAYALFVGNRPPAPRPDPVIIRPDDLPPIIPDGNETVAESGAVDQEPGVLSVPEIGPIDVDGTAASVPRAPNDQFSEPVKRAAAYKASSAALKKTVDQYAKTRANHCSGEITVQTDDTPLNVRSGPSTGSPVLSKATKGSKQSVLLWAPDAKNQSNKWFLLVDTKTKAVKGWVSGDYCDTAGVVFPR